MAVKYTHNKYPDSPDTKISQITSLFLKSNTGKMLVLFQSDWIVPNPGFSANYSSTGSAHCLTTTNLNTTDWCNISDGSGVNQYCNNIDCFIYISLLSSFN